MKGRPPGSKNKKGAAENETRRWCSNCYRKRFLHLLDITEVPMKFRDGKKKVYTCKDGCAGTTKQLILF